MESENPLLYTIPQISKLPVSMCICNMIQWLDPVHQCIKNTLDTNSSGMMEFAELTLWHTLKELFLFIYSYFFVRVIVTQ